MTAGIVHARGPGRDDMDWLFAPNSTGFGSVDVFVSDAGFAKKLRPGRLQVALWGKRRSGDCRPLSPPREHQKPYLVQRKVDFLFVADRSTQIDSGSV